jgi:hypothetical protein
MNEVGMIRSKSIKAAVLAVAGLALAACGGASNAQEAQADDEGPGFFSRMMKSEDKRNPGPCPLIGVLYESSRLVEFRAPGERLANVGFTGEVNSVRGLCTYTGDKPIEMNLDIEMSFGRGPMAMQDETRVYRYWVAVTRTNVAPIAKQYFDIEVKFPRGAQIVRHSEKIKRIVIPRANADVAGPSFEVLVGFELTPEQLAFNRAGKRFRLDAGG